MGRGIASRIFAAVIVMTVGAAMTADQLTNEHDPNRGGVMVAIGLAGLFVYTGLGLWFRARAPSVAEEDEDERGGQQRAKKLVAFKEPEASPSPVASKRRSGWSSAVASALVPRARAWGPLVLSLWALYYAHEASEEARRAYNRAEEADDGGAGEEALRKVKGCRCAD
jgi:hypothetical protein